MDGVAVAMLGGLVGTSELVSRYRDAPGVAMRSLPAIFYIFINAAASMAALEFIDAHPSWFDSQLTRNIVAGVSSMALFRTSLFVVRVGDRDVDIGPSGLLQVFLGAADRAVDRSRASARRRSRPSRAWAPRRSAGRCRRPG